MEIKEKVIEIVKYGRMISSSKLPYLADHPDVICKTLELDLLNSPDSPIGIKIQKSTCRLVVRGMIMAEFQVGEQFKWPLHFAKYATEIGRPKFHVSIKDDYSFRGNRTREEVMEEFINLFKNSSITVNRGCTIECYQQQISQDDQGITVDFECLECTNRNHVKCCARRHTRHRSEMDEWIMEVLMRDAPVKRQRRNH